MTRPNSILGKGVKNHFQQNVDPKNPWQWNDFVRFMALPVKKRPAVARLAEMFGIKRSETMQKWITAYEIEKARK